MKTALQSFYKRHSRRFTILFIFLLPVSLLLSAVRHDSSLAIVGYGLGFSLALSALISMTLGVIRGSSTKPTDPIRDPDPD